MLLRTSRNVLIVESKHAQHVQHAQHAPGHQAATFLRAKVNVGHECPREVSLFLTL